MESQPPHPGCRGDQKYSIRSSIASLRRTTDRTIRREYLDHTLFWNASSLERKLREFRHYYNHHRVHSSLNRNTPAKTSLKSIIRRADLSKYGWLSFCRGLYQLPTAA